MTKDASKYRKVCKSPATWILAEPITRHRPEKRSELTHWTNLLNRYSLSSLSQTGTVNRQSLRENYIKLLFNLKAFQFCVVCRFGSIPSTTWWRPFRDSTIRRFAAPNPRSESYGESWKWCLLRAMSPAFAGAIICIEWNLHISLIAVKVLWLVISSWLDDLDAFPHHPVLVAMQKGDRINHSFDLNRARVGTLRRMSSLQWMDGLGSWTTWLHWNWAPFLLKRWKYKCSLSQFCMLDICNYRTLTVCRLFWISMTLVLQHLAINTFSWAKVGETLLWCRHDRSISIAVPKVTRLVQPASSLRQDISSGLHEGVHGMNHVCVCVCTLMKGKRWFAVHWQTYWFHITLSCPNFAFCRIGVSSDIAGHYKANVSKTANGSTSNQSKCSPHSSYNRCFLIAQQLRQVMRPQKFRAKPANLKKFRSCSEAR